MMLYLSVNGLIIHGSRAKAFESESLVADSHPSSGGADMPLDLPKFNTEGNGVIGRHFLYTVWRWTPLSTGMMAIGRQQSRVESGSNKALVYEILGFEKDKLFG